jgi:hypothetical protein
VDREIRGRYALTALDFNLRNSSSNANKRDFRDVAPSLTLVVLAASLYW